MIKYNPLIQSALPSVIFLVIFFLDLLLADYGKKYDAILYLGLVLLFFLMTMSNRYDISKFDGGNYFKTSFLFTSFIYGIWLSFELIFNGFNSIVGVILLILSYNSLMFPHVYREENSTLLNQKINFLIKFLFIPISLFMATLALLNIFSGKWEWRYYFLY